MRHYIKYYGVGTLIVLMVTAFFSVCGKPVLRGLIILAALMLLFLVKASAQVPVKPVPAPAKAPVKPTWESGLKAADIVPFKIIGGVTLQQAQDYSFFESVGEAWFSNPANNNVSAPDYMRMRNNHQLVLDTLKKKFSSQVLVFVQDRIAKFTADTTAKYHPKK